MPAITCCPPHSFKALLPTEEKWEKALVAISVGSLSTQGLFRPLPPITWLIGNHLSHTWMSSSHEEEEGFVAHPPEATKPFSPASTIVVAPPFLLLHTTDIKSWRN